MIEANSPEHKKFVQKTSTHDYDILVDKIPTGESIRCSDDKDMVVIPQEDGTVILSKKAFSNKCFSK